MENNIKVVWALYKWNYLTKWDVRDHKYKNKFITFLNEDRAETKADKWMTHKKQRMINIKTNSAIIEIH